MRRGWSFCLRHSATVSEIQVMLCGHLIIDSRAALSRVQSVAGPQGIIRCARRLSM